MPDQGYRGGVLRDLIQNPASELRRIPLPRTSVNKGDKEGPGIYPRPFFVLCSLSLAALLLLLLLEGSNVTALPLRSLNPPLVRLYNGAAATRGIGDVVNRGAALKERYGICGAAIALQAIGVEFRVGIAFGSSLGEAKTEIVRDVVATVGYGPQTLLGRR